LCKREEKERENIRKTPGNWIKFFGKKGWEGKWGTEGEFYIVICRGGTGLRSAGTAFGTWREKENSAAKGGAR